MIQMIIFILLSIFLSACGEVSISSRARVPDLGGGGLGSNPKPEPIPVPVESKKRIYSKILVSRDDMPQNQVGNWFKTRWLFVYDLKTNRFITKLSLGSVQTFTGNRSQIFLVDETDTEIYGINYDFYTGPSLNLSKPTLVFFKYDKVNQTVYIIKKIEKAPLPFGDFNTPTVVSDCDGDNLNDVLLGFDCFSSKTGEITKSIPGFGTQFLGIKGSNIQTDLDGDHLGEISIFDYDSANRLYAIRIMGTKTIDYTKSLNDQAMLARFILPKTYIGCAGPDTVIRTTSSNISITDLNHDGKKELSGFGINCGSTAELTKDHMQYIVDESGQIVFSKFFPKEKNNDFFIGKFTNTENYEILTYNYSGDNSEVYSIYKPDSSLSKTISTAEVMSYFKFNPTSRSGGISWLRNTFDIDGDGADEVVDIFNSAIVSLKNKKTIFEMPKDEIDPSAPFFLSRGLESGFIVY